MKSKDAAQPTGNHAAYQLLCLCSIDSTMSVLLYFKQTKFPAPSHLENQSLNTGGGGVNSKFAFDIINEHLYTLFQAVESLNILTLTTIFDSMHTTLPNNSI